MDLCELLDGEGEAGRQDAGVISHERLLELVSYDEKTGLFTNLRRGKHIKNPGGICGSVDNSTGYVRIRLDRTLYYAHRLAWLYVHGVAPPNQIDHINFNREDNRINNLRLATASENSYHHKCSKKNTSGYRGVSWHKDKNKWRATIKANGKWRFLGYFPDRESAYQARVAATIILHKEFTSPAISNDNLLLNLSEAS